MNLTVACGARMFCQPVRPTRGASMRFDKARTQHRSSHPLRRVWRRARHTRFVRARLAGFVFLVLARAAAPPRDAASIAFDQPGSASRIIRTPAYDSRLRRDLVALLRRARHAIVGFSSAIRSGTFVARRAAIAVPERVVALVLIGTGASTKITARTSFKPRCASYPIPSQSRSRASSSRVRCIARSPPSSSTASSRRA